MFAWLKRDIWSVVMLSVRDMNGNGQGQGRKRATFYFVLLAATAILSSVYWQYKAVTYADMFPLMSSMYLVLMRLVRDRAHFSFGFGFAGTDLFLLFLCWLSCVMVVQFTHFNQYITEARHLLVDQKREAYSSGAYFTHALMRDSFFFCTGAAVMWIPASYAIDFAGIVKMQASKIPSKGMKDESSFLDYCDLNEVAS